MPPLKVRATILIFFLAVSSRVLYLEEIKDTPFFHHPMVDSGDYERYSAIMAEDGMAKEYTRRFWRIPFYKLFLALVYKVAGRNVYFARLIQAVMGGLSSCLIYLLGGAVFNRRVGLVSGIVGSLYWPFIAFGAKFLPVNLAIFFSLLSALALYNFLVSGKLLWLLGSGAFLAFSSMAQANFLLVFPAILLWLSVYFYKKLGTVKSASYFLIFAIGFLSVLSPAIIKDYNRRKELIPVQKNYGVGIYFGSRLDLINIKPGSAWKKLMRELLERDLVSSGERNIYWFKKTKELIAKDPARFVKDLHKKIYILLNAYEFSPRENINYFKRKSRILAAAFFNFGFVACFAVPGIFLALRKDRGRAFPLFLFGVVYWASLLPFMPLARYRLPVAPFLLVFASYCFLEFTDLLRGRRWRRALKIFTVVLPLFVLTNTNTLFGYLERFSRPCYYRGLVHYAHNDIRKAISDFECALKKNPRDPDIYEAIGDAYFKTGNLVRAEKSYEKALEIESRFPEALEKLGVVYANRGKVEEAKAAFMEVLSSFPTESVKAHINLGNCYAGEGNDAMAEAEYKRALELSPNDIQALRRLALLYEETGNLKARDIWKRYEHLIENLKKKAERDFPRGVDKYDSI